MLLRPEPLKPRLSSSDMADMWKRTDTTESTNDVTEASETRSPQIDTVQPPPAAAASAPSPVSSAHTSATLGHSVVIKGDLTGQEDLMIEGRVEGTIESKQHSVVIGQQAEVKAKILAKDVVVLGKVVGDISASTKIEIRPQGRVEGDLVAPAVAIAEGATFRGSIDMSQQSAESAA